MEDYEQTAIVSMEKLKEKHLQDLENLSIHIKNSLQNKYKKRSKESIDLQK